MIFMNVEFSKELFNFVENNLDKITNLDDIFSLPNFNLIKTCDVNSTEDNLYINMVYWKRMAQLKLNLYKSTSEYRICEIKQVHNLSMKDYWNKSDKKSEKSNMIDMICNYIQYYQTIKAIELLKNKTYFSIKENICFYCDSPIQPYQKTCTVCEADLSEMNMNTKYLNDGSLSSNKSSVYKTIYKHENDKIINSRGKTTTACNDKNEVQCGKCTFINKRGTASCVICFSSLEANHTAKVEYSNHDADIRNKVSLTLKNSTCFTCGFRKTSTNCNICLTISKWECEQCTFLNDFLNNQCEICNSKNTNIDNCIKCKTQKVPVEKNICDNCLANNHLWRCWFPSCGELNAKSATDCKKCGIQSTKVFYEFLTRNGKKTDIWLCESCQIINTGGTKKCKKCQIILSDMRHFCQNCDLYFSVSNSNCLKCHSIPYEIIQDFNSKS